MTEKISTPKPAEPEVEKKPRVEAEDHEGHFEAYASWGRETLIVQESPEVCSEKIAELQALLENFERKHDLEALHEITAIRNMVEAEAYPTRQAAKLDLVPIFELRKHLKTQSNVPKEAMQSLDVHYEKIQSAIGVATDNGLDHGPR